MSRREHDLSWLDRELDDAITDKLAALPAEPLRTRAEIRREVVFHGELGKRFGTRHAMAGESLQEIMLAIDEQRDGRLRKYLCDETPERKVGFRVWADGEEVPADRLSLVLAKDTKQIEVAPFPLAAGKSGGFIATVVGVLLIIIGSILLFTPFGPLGSLLIDIGYVLVVGGGVAALLAPGSSNLPSTGGGGPAGFGFQGTIQGASQGAPKPVIWGEVWASGVAVSASSRAAGEHGGTENDAPGGRPLPDDFFHDAERVVVDLLSEGEIEGFAGDPLDCIRLNETKLRDLLEDEKGELGFELRTGTATQAPLTLAPSPETEIGVGVEMLKDRPITRSTTTGSALRAVRVNLVLTQLLHATAEGERREDLAFTISIADTAPGGQTTMIQRAYYSKAKQRRNLTFELPCAGTGPWNVTVTKTTEDTEGSHYRGVTWEGFTEVSNAQLRHPGSALVAMKWRASQIPGNIERRYLTRGLKCRVPSNYDAAARTYTGDWDGTFQADKHYTANPLWQACEYLTNRIVGLGRLVTDADINWLSAYRSAQRCDTLVSNQKGGLEPRHSFNLHDTARANAWRKLLEHLSAAFTVPYYDGHRIGFSQDRPGSVRDVVVPASVIGGTFEYSGSGVKDLNTRVVVQYANADDLDRAGSEVVEDPALIKLYGIVSRDVRAVGIRSPSEAQRWAYWLLLMEQAGEVCSFRMGPRARGYLPMDVLNVYDPDRGITYETGLAKFAESNAITLDKTVTLDAGVTYRLTVAQPFYRLDLMAAKNVAQLLLTYSLGNDDPELVTVRQDWDGDGEYEVVRTVQGYDAGLKRVELGPQVGADGTSVPTRIEWMLPVYTGDVTSPAGDTQRLTLATAFDLPPLTHTPWALKRPNQDGERWRVVARGERDDQVSYEVVCLKYDSTRYTKIDALPDFPVVPIEHEPIPAFGSDVPPPVSADGFIERRAISGASQRVVGVRWAEASATDRNRHSIIGYEVTASRDSEPGVVVGELVRYNEFVLVEPEYGLWSFWVRSVDVEGRRSKPVNARIAYDEHSIAAGGAGSIVGLRIKDSSNGYTSEARDFVLAWDYAEPGADGEVFNSGAQAPATVDAFVVEVIDTRGGGTLRTHETREFGWTYTNDMNRADQAKLGRHAALRAPRFRGWVRDVVGHDGPTTDLYPSNPARRAPAGIAVTSTPGNLAGAAQAVIHAEITATGEPTPPPDAQGMAVWASTTPGFTPIRDNFKGRATGNFLSFPAASKTQWYLRIGLYDSFNGDPALLEDPAAELELSAEETILTVDSATLPIQDGDLAPGAVTDMFNVFGQTGEFLGTQILASGSVQAGVAGGRVAISGHVNFSAVPGQSPNLTGYLEVKRQFRMLAWFFFNGTSYVDVTAQWNGTGAGSADTCPRVQAGTPGADYLYAINEFPYSAGSVYRDFEYDTPVLPAGGSNLGAEYWTTGGVWAPLPSFDSGGNFIALPLTGHHMSWNLPVDWAPRTVNGVYGYAFRIGQLNSVGPTGPSGQQNAIATHSLVIASQTSFPSGGAARIVTLPFSEVIAGAKPLETVVLSAFIGSGNSKISSYTMKLHAAKDGFT